jgi:putative mRNA 3-end processing factor
MAMTTWLRPDSNGLFCIPGGFYIDPARPVSRALITHGHSDHARAGHEAYLATPETVEVMKLRLGQNHNYTSTRYHETHNINGVSVRFIPAGHILGSAQIVLEWQGQRIVASGDYKRSFDPTCAPFEPVPCDVFITEATFALPVFCHEPADKEAARLLVSIAQNPQRNHLLGVYGLGKAQRVIALLRQQGFDRTIWLHGALVELCKLYERLGVKLGDVRPVSETDAKALKGELILCPPSATDDRWAAKFGDSITSFASGWMRVRARARQRGAELPLIISDHADWPELLQTIEDVEAPEIWVTHGREDALVHQLSLMGRKARALALVGFEDEAE